MRVLAKYYQASRLVEFVSEELNWSFMHEFMSSHSIEGCDFSLSNPQFICKIASEYGQFLKDQQDSEDKWIAMHANFLEISFDFSRFVDGYRLDDSIALEFGHHKQMPVWQATSQNKYVDITHGQHETLYRDSTYQVLQEI